MQEVNGRSTHESRDKSVRARAFGGMSAITSLLCSIIYSWRTSTHLLTGSCRGWHSLRVQLQVPLLGSSLDLQTAIHRTFSLTKQLQTKSTLTCVYFCVFANIFKSSFLPIVVRGVFFFFNRYQRTQQHILDRE